MPRARANPDADARKSGLAPFAAFFLASLPTDADAVAFARRARREARRRRACGAVTLWRRARKRRAG